jgi:pimeloyl-ACP methyl ester carboxylesterase
MSTLLTRRFGAWCIGLVLLGSGAAAAAADANPNKMIGVDGGQLHVVQDGSGPFTVVFEAGFASDLSVWRKVMPDTAKQARVLAYSRAGTGQSPARAAPVGLEQSAAEFAQMLAAAGAKPPYILVGHSYGAFMIRHFAARHPEQVAGLVFVDPADEGLEAALKRVDAARVLQDQQALAASMPPKWKGDLALIQKILDAGQLPAMPALPDVPAAVITSVRARAQSDFFQETPAAVRIKRERHQAFFSQFSSGAHVVTPNSGHTIQMMEPQLVQAAIAQTLASATQLAERRARQAARQTLMQVLENEAPKLAGNERVPAQARVQAAVRSGNFSEADLNTIGFDLLTKGKQVALATLLLKYNAEAFPRSDNAADSYGEALLAARQTREARQQFQRAIDAGKANGAGERAMAAYRANLAKAEAMAQQP